MDKIRIIGGGPLQGTIRVSGSKNAALPILCASLLVDGESTFRNVPNLRDIGTTARLLRHLGLDVEAEPPIVKINNRGIKTDEAPYE